MIWIFMQSSLAAQPTPTPLGPSLEQRDSIEARHPTCFPVETALFNEVLLGHVSGPVFLEEESSCPKGGQPTLHPPVVPKEIVGDQSRLQYVLDHAAVATTYEIEARAGGWLVAPAGKPPLADTLVSVDAKTAPTLGDAEQQIFDQVAKSAWVAFSPNRFEDSPVPNEVSLTKVPMLEALRAIRAPSETSPIGYLFRIDPGAAPNGMRFGDYAEAFAFDFSGPPMPIKGDLLQK